MLCYPTGRIYLPVGETKVANTFDWTNERVLFLKSNYSVMGPVKLAKELGTSLASVMAKAKRLGIRPKSNSHAPYEWTEERLKLIKELYPTADRQTLVDRIGLPYYAIQTMARKLKLFNTTGHSRGAKTLEKNNTSVNIHFFDKWTPDMAYVFGFLMADGSIHKSLGEAIVGIHVKDISVVEFIAKVTESKRKFYYQTIKNDWSGKEPTPVVYLILASKILVRRLMELGMKPRKTYTNDPFPNVPDDMIPHFTRGYFDGDGSAYIDRSWGGCHISLIGATNLVTGLRDSLVRLAGMFKRKTVIQPVKSPCVRVIWSKREDVKKFHKFIYPKGFSFCLQRKKDVMDKWLRDTIIRDPDVKIVLVKGD